MGENFSEMVRQRGEIVNSEKKGTVYNTTCCPELPFFSNRYDRRGHVKHDQIKQLTPLCFGTGGKSGPSVPGRTQKGIHQFLTCLLKMWVSR